MTIHPKQFAFGGLLALLVVAVGFLTLNTKTIISKAVDGGCDNGVSIGGTACRSQGDSVQYRCQTGSVPGNSIWKSESCGSNSNCQGTACKANASTSKPTTNPVAGCDNGVSIGGTACRSQGDSVQYRCQTGSVPGNSIWKSESCGNGSTCQGAACKTTTTSHTCSSSELSWGFSGNSLSVSGSNNCTGYAYIKKYTCSGNVSVCNQNEQTIGQGGLSQSVTASPSCGQTVQVDIDVYQASGWVGHIDGRGIARYGGNCPNPTPTPTVKPTPTVSPSPTPTASPTPTPGVCNAYCQSNSDCVSGYCYQPPMPTCPSGAVCPQVIPHKVCRTLSCPTSNTCGCPTATPTASPSPTPTASPTPSPTPTPTPTACPTPTPSPVCKLENLNVVPEPDARDWNHTGHFKVTNTASYSQTFEWLLDVWGSRDQDQRGTTTLAPGKSIVLGLGKICSKWQLDLGCDGKERGFVIEPYQPACVTPTPTPTASPSPTPTASPSPTPTVSPSPTPTASPTPSPTPASKFRVCKFEDVNGNGSKDSGEQGLSWKFTYKSGNGNESSYETNAGHWYQLWRNDKGCGPWVTVAPSTSVFVKENDVDGWVAITAKEQTHVVTEENYTFTFGNQKKVIPTPTPTASPTPTPTASPTPSPTPASCNQTCIVDSDCVSGLVCYQDGSSKYCRHPDNKSSSSCDTRKTGGFFIRKYHDENGNGYQDKDEKGISWKFQWDSNADNNWHDYETFGDHLGEGGVVTLPEGTQVRIREKSADGWTATTATEVTITIKAGDNQMMVFGNWRGKPQVLGTSTTPTLPKTGAETVVIGTFGSFAMYGIGLWIKRKGL